MGMENARPVAQALEHQLVDEPVPLLGSAQIAAAITRRQHGAEGEPGNRRIAQLTPGDCGQCFVETGEAFAHVSLGD